MKVFRHYPEVEMDKLIGYTIVNVLVGEDQGFLIEAEREVSGGKLGIDIRYDEEDEVELTISNEYIKCISKEVPATKEYFISEAKKLVSETKEIYESAKDCCGEDDEIVAIPAKESYERAKAILAHLEQGV